MKVPYVIALKITGLDGIPGPSWYSEDKLKSPKIRQIIKKVQVEPDAECDELRLSGKGILTKVEISTRGNRYAERILIKGSDPRSRIVSDKELEEKFKYLAGLVLSKEKVKQLSELLNKLENIENIHELTELLY
jgi:2-methylcitrate dehydratase PrpD